MYNVLVIEDDKDFAEILVECLHDNEFHFHDVINDQASAQAEFKAGILQDIDAVLVDLQMPRSSVDPTINMTAGLELIEEMRLRHNFCGRVIVLTNSYSLVDVQRGLNAGCDGYLCKCLKMSDLPRLITEVQMAIRAEVMMLSSEMRYVFLREHFQDIQQGTRIGISAQPAS